LDRELFSQFDWTALRVNIAFVPYWFLEDTDGRFIVYKIINPQHIYAIHISPQDNEKVIAALKEINRSIIPMTKMLQKFRLEFP